MQTQIINRDIDIVQDTLRSLGAGALLSETASNLKNAIRAAKLTGKPSSIAIKINIKPDPDTGEILLAGTNSINLPKQPIKSRFFVTDNMLPSRTAPEQMILNFKG